MLPDLTSALMGGFPNLTSADKGGRGVQNPKKCADIICERPLYYCIGIPISYHMMIGRMLIVVN